MIAHYLHHASPISHRIFIVTAYCSPHFFLCLDAGLLHHINISLTIFLSFCWYLCFSHFFTLKFLLAFISALGGSVTDKLPEADFMIQGMVTIYDSKVIARYPSTSEKCFLSFDYSYSKRPQFFVYIFIAIYLIFLPICLSIYIYTKPSIHENISLSIYLFDVVLSAFCNTLCISV